MKLVTSSHKVWMILVALLAMAALGAGPALAQQAVKPAPMKSIQVKPVTRVVPDVLGKTLTEAQKILKKAGFKKVEIKGARAKGARVLSQKPKGGTRSSLDVKVILNTALQKAGPAASGPEVARREYPTEPSSSAGKKRARKPAEATSKRWDPGDYSSSTSTTKRKSAKKPTSGTPGIGTSPIAPGGDRAPPKPDLPVFQADKPIVVYPPKAILVINHVRFTGPVSRPNLAQEARPIFIVGYPLRIYVSVANIGPADSITSDFRVYLSRAGKLLQKVSSHAPLSGLKGNSATYAEFYITLPNKQGLYCWEVSLKQTLDGRMTLGDPKNLCAQVNAFTR